MSQSAQDFFTGMGSGVLLLIIVLTFVPGSTFKMAKAAIDECERTLPRDQKCTVIAVPIVEPK